MKKPARFSHVRNIGIAAHVDAGKTTLTERILFYTGASYKIGEVHDGAAHMDYMAEEQQHGITITAAVTKAPWRDHQIQLIDTPGHVDFTVEVERAMRVLDGCVIVLDGVRGVEPQTETVWRQRSHFKLPTLFFVNKMDRPGADFRRSLAAVKQRLGAEPAPIALPLPDDGAVIHLIERTLIRFTGEQGETIVSEPCPPDLWETCGDLREALLLAAAEIDDSVAEAVLSGSEPPPEDVRAALRQGTLDGRLCPCYGGSALRNMGVQPLLDGILDFLPAPLDRPPALAENPDGEQVPVAMDPHGPLAALAFKVQLWDGRRHVFVRLYRGTLEPGDKVAFITGDGRVQHEQAARLFEIDAGKKTKLDRAEAGQIVLIAGLRWATTGDTLCAPGHLVALERIALQAPVLGLAIEPTAGTDEERLLEVLGKIEQEDPTLLVEEDPETGQRLLRGMGELHLQIVLERIEREFGLQIRAGRPAVAVRETIRRRAQAEALFAPPPRPDARQPDLMARVAVTLEPLPRGSGSQTQVTPRILPEGSELTQAQIQAIRDGLKGGLISGPLQGTQVLDLEVRVTEVELFGPGSTPEALAAATAKALRKALEAASPVLMRPIMRLEVVVPEASLGGVLGDLQSRHALIRQTDTLGDQVTVQAEVALEPLLGYSTELRSMTQGRGQFSMQFERFDLC
ncbi:elongation factor G [Imhoffiella purpurea]|uniref:Translation elongation factor G-related protein n=1 Tax=Imhoffiella purpurea TaxID=1249627 RepID=W9V1L9_9GAMM|nr:elongation factor G [Imhoffiella purpurea]EXJ13353.1 Translation elongation factor G-related protein [Imhoffiella purpurea]